MSWNLGVRVSQVKTSYCFRLHPTSMISKHSTIPVPGSLQAPLKISFTFHFWHKSYILDDVKLAELSDNSFWMKEFDILRKGVKTYSDPPTYFHGVRIPQPPGSTPLACLMTLLLPRKIFPAARPAMRHLETTSDPHLRIGQQSFESQNEVYSFHKKNFSKIFRFYTAFGMLCGPTPQRRALRGPNTYCLKSTGGVSVFVKCYWVVRGGPWWRCCWWW